MFSASRALFIYCVSPVHMGAGTAIGLIDNPIQRERHTDYPMMASSGLKGAVRHHFQASWDKVLLDRLFGPEGNGSVFYAGAVSFGDAQLVAFPVRSVKNGFVYATSPTALARAARSLVLSGSAAPWPQMTVEIGQCKLVNRDLLSSDSSDQKHLHLEALQLHASIDKPLQQISEWLAANALPRMDAFEFFRAKLKDDLVLLHDEDFSYFVRNATVVEPHINIEDKTGTAKDGGLFYTENLPPESLLLAPLMASVERSGKDGALVAKEVLDTVMKDLDGTLVQVGGDATTGRGQVIFKAVGGNN